MAIELKGKQLGAYVTALESAYADPDLFDQMMLVHLGRRRSTYTLANNIRTRFFDVIERSRMEGWTAQLIAASLDANPDNPALVQFARHLGLDPVPAAEAANLEKVVTESSRFQNASFFLANFARRIDWTCQIVMPGGGGTGVLVADDLILTNHHVMAAVINGQIPAHQVACRFDFKKLNDGGEISLGRRVALHEEGVIASQPHSPEDVKRNGDAPAADALDYALMRLAEPVGAEALGPKGATDVLSQRRGYMTISENPPGIAVNDPVVILQHPLLPGRLIQEPIQLAIGSLLKSPYMAYRLRHNARTLGGSSGSPCFNADLTMIALHHAGDPVTKWERPEWNQAIPIRAIIADLAKRHNVPKFWSD